MDGTVTQILKDVHKFLSDKHYDPEAMKLRARVGFAIDLNHEIDMLIDKAKEISDKSKEST